MNPNVIVTLTTFLFNGYDKILKSATLNNYVEIGSLIHSYGNEDISKIPSFGTDIP